jgi:hypothetical protein
MALQSLAFPNALLKKMVLAQFKKDLANLQALAQKGGTYEAVTLAMIL